MMMGVFRTVSDIGLVLGPIVLGAISDALSYDAALRLNGLLFVTVGIAFGALAVETRRRSQRADTSGTLAGA